MSTANAHPPWDVPVAGVPACASGVLLSCHASLLRQCGVRSDVPRLPVNFCPTHQSTLPLRSDETVLMHMHMLMLILMVS